MSRLFMLCRFASILSLCLFLIFQEARAESSPAFDVLHQQYLSLRNTDLQFRRLPEWQKLSRELIDLSWKEKNPLIAQRALLEGAILFDTLARKIDSRLNSLRALGLLEDLVGRFPAGMLADDALMRQSQILRRLGKTDEAERILQQIVKDFPNSDMSLVAATQLKRGHGFQSPASDPSLSGRPVVVLDPGHGGEDFGAVGVGGLLEKDVALDVALRTKKLIEAGGTYRVVLTRNQDKFVPLADRMSLANRLKAKLFVSIHANASVSKELSGIETYYLDNKSDKASEKLAERENRAGAAGSGQSNDLSFMLSDLIQNAKLPESIALARAVQRSIISQARQEASDTRDLGVKSGPFYVLVGAHMPCVLIEVAFIDNAREGRLLGDVQFRDVLAQGIASGVSDFSR